MYKSVVLQADRLRRPRRFGWVDHGIVLDGFLGRMSPAAQRLYLFLCVVANRDGVSWHSDARIVAATGLAPAMLESGRRDLIDADLVGFGCPYYQVLSLPRVQSSAPASPACRTDRASQPASAADVSAAFAAIRQNLQPGGE